MERPDIEGWRKWLRKGISVYMSRAVVRKFIDYIDHLERQATPPPTETPETEWMRRAEDAAGMRLCFYQPRAARLMGKEGWLCESADDNGQSYASCNIAPTREACARTVIAEAAHQKGETDGD